MRREGKGMEEEEKRGNTKEGEREETDRQEGKGKTREKGR